MRAGPVQVREGPSDYSQLMPWVVQHPGAVVLTTGRAQDNWIEVRNAHLRTGWVPLSALVACPEAGTHGDDGETAGWPEDVIHEHNHTMLCFDLRPPEMLRAAQRERGPRGFYHARHSGQEAHVWVPENDRHERLPLLIVLHGSRPLDWPFFSWTQRWQKVANNRGVAVVVPQSRGPTWDFLLTGQRQDMNFIEAVVNDVRRLYDVDDSRIAVMGVSDGASMGLSMALHNPSVFQTALVQATGFFIERHGSPPQPYKPTIFMEYGALDELFNLQTVALPNRDRLCAAGFDVTFQAIDGAGHCVQDGFFDDAVEFWQAQPPHRGLTDSVAQPLVQQQFATIGRAQAKSST